ncbi:MAG TPA: alpha/beta fold hydrolase [Burkholderiaceae bacterium]
MQIAANGVSIEVDDQGPPGGPPILLLMGLGMQLTGWPDELVRLLVGRGFRVIRIDNRDAGLSQGFDTSGRPKLAWATLRYTLHLPVHSPYTLADMAGDAFGVLDALGLPAAHVCGASMGGMIAQHMAASQPERVSRLTLIMTTSGARGLPQPGPRVRVALLDGRPSGMHDVDAEVTRLMRLFTLIGSPAYRPEPEEFRARLTASVRRAWRPAGVARQLIAVAADGDRTPLLSRIGAPTHIVHGAADPLVPVAAAHDLHAKIAGSTLEIIDGLGHDLPAPLWPRFAAAIGRH